MNQLQKYIEEVLNSAANFEPSYLDNSFPKYRITQISSNNFVLDVALAGYDKKNIKVKTAGNRLSVSYTKPEVKEEEKKEFPKVTINQIAQRDFDKVWLTDEKFNLKVNKVSFENGILSVDVDIEIPENLKEKEYTIK
jgi:molecular chaperone IbpA